MKYKKILLVVIILIILLFYLYINFTLNKKQFYLYEPIEIHIEKGETFSEIMFKLKQNNLLSDPLLCKLYFVLINKHKLIKAGYYKFDKSLSIKEIAEKLVKGEIIYYKLTFPEGSNVFDIARIIEAEKVIGYEEYFKIINSKEILKELKKIDNEINNVEGYLFPETYYFAKGERLQELIKMMIKEFIKRNNESLKIKSKELGYTVHQIVSIASLIEKESGNDEEKPLIASVFYNRLKKNMLLQCDPTVIYSHYLQGKIIGILKKEDLTITSSYNTYQNLGLPPGPICNPGKESLYAAMNPAKTDYLYFVSMGNGSHYFSKTLDEHLRAKAKYLR